MVCKRMQTFAKGCSSAGACPRHTSRLQSRGQGQGQAVLEGDPGGHVLQRLAGALRLFTALRRSTPHLHLSACVVARFRTSMFGSVVLARGDARGEESKKSAETVLDEAVAEASEAKDGESGDSSDVQVKFGGVQIRGIPGTSGRYLKVSQGISRYLQDLQRWWPEGSRGVRYSSGYFGMTSPNLSKPRQSGESRGSGP